LRGLTIHQPPLTGVRVAEARLATWEQFV
jgi:hypothetical protein